MNHLPFILPLFAIELNPSSPQCLVQNISTACPFPARDGAPGWSEMEDLETSPAVFSPAHGFAQIDAINKLKAGLTQSTPLQFASPPCAAFSQTLRRHS